MPSSHYSWSAGDAPPTIKNHSLVKHEILGEYLRRYVATLLKKRRGDSLLKLTVVDGFAGGGQYLDEHSREIRQGSPLIILNAIREAEVTANPKGTGVNRVDARFVFTEKSKRNCEYLDRVLRDSEYGRLIDDRISIRNDRFENQLAGIMREVESRSRSRRVIFVLDQYGYTSVPLSVIHRILNWSQNAEVILTFATDSLIDYLRTTEKWAARLENVGLGRLTTNVETLKEQEKHEWREVIQKWLHRGLWGNSGAGFYTPFFLHSSEAHRCYWLIHLSGHPRARDVMVGLHWEKNNRFVHYGDPGLNMLGMLGYDPSCDLQFKPVQRLFEFDGDARERTMSALIEQLPERVASFRQGVTFAEFFAQTTNETPATETMLKEAVLRHVKEKEIVVTSSHGKVRRVEKHIDPDDVIQRSRARRLFVPQR